MSFILNGVTLKRPTTIQRMSIEVAKEHIVLTGQVKRDIVRQKEIYILPFEMLSQVQVQDIMTIYQLKRPVTLAISELSINTTVWVKIQNREMGARGTDYRENIVLNLEEV